MMAENWRGTWVVAYRELLRFIRDRSRMVSSFAFPLLFLVIFGAGFSQSMGALAPGERVETWRELSPTLASMLDSARGMMVMVFLIVYIAIGILILNAMLMAVFERIREFGVLKAIGYSPGRVLLLIFGETAVQTGLAILVGGILAAPGLWYLVHVGIDMGRLGGMAMMGVVLDPIWRGVVGPDVILGPLVTLLVIVGMATLYPAAKAAWINPIRAIQHR